MARINLVVDHKATLALSQPGCSLRRNQDRPERLILGAQERERSTMSGEGATAYYYQMSE